jgi:hypothetical protein
LKERDNLKDKYFDGRTVIWITIKETEQKDADRIQLAEDGG